MQPMVLRAADGREVARYYDSDCLLETDLSMTETRFYFLGARVLDHSKVDSHVQIILTDLRPEVSPAHRARFAAAYLRGYVKHAYLPEVAA